eukprot:scaffold32961_cov70-Cyclotella_meneghiniana.AAC.13
MRLYVVCRVRVASGEWARVGELGVGDSARQRALPLGPTAYRALQLGTWLGLGRCSARTRALPLSPNSSGFRRGARGRVARVSEISDFR